MLLKREKCQNMSEGRVDTQYINLTNKSGVIAADTNTGSTSASGKNVKSGSKYVQHLRLTALFTNCRSKVLRASPTATN